MYLLSSWVLSRLDHGAIYKGEGWDLNSHRITPTRITIWRVYQFRHQHHIRLWYVFSFIYICKKILEIMVVYHSYSCNKNSFHKLSKIFFLYIPKILDQYLNILLLFYGTIHNKQVFVFFFSFHTFSKSFYL